MRALLLLVLVIVAPLVSAASATGPAANFTLKSAGGEISDSVNTAARWCC